VKSESDVRKRLKKLRSVLLKRGLSETQSRRFENCVFNHRHVPTDRKRASEDGPEPQTAYPRPLRPVHRDAPDTKFLVVLQDDAVHLCMFGAEKPDQWPGDTCESDDIAKRCKMFRPKISAEEVTSSVSSLLEDDAYVLEHHKDIAALQWVLDERVHAYPLSLFERIVLRLRLAFFKPEPVINSLPPARDADERFGGEDDSDKDS
jgi:hypothetical protein